MCTNKKISMKTKEIQLVFPFYNYPRFFRNLFLFTLLLCVLLGTGASAHPGSGIVIDKYGQVYFTDTGRGIWKIDNQGKLTSIPASLFHWMTIDEGGYFAESPKRFGEWFERVTPQSSKPVLIMSSDFPLTINRDGNIYYADTRPSSAGIVRRTPAGTETVLAHGEMFKGITGITPGPDGSLYFTDASNADANAIRKITMDGKVTTIASGFLGKSNTNVPPPETDAGYCRGLAVDSLGNVYVAATGSRRVLKITPQGKVSTILEATSPWSPTGVAVFHSEVYVLEWREPAASESEVRIKWMPRVRKVGRDEKITTLAIVTR
jgi:sugar lactone lactonase YvrE